MRKILSLVLGVMLLCSALAFAVSDSAGGGASGATGGQMVGDDADEHGCIGSAGYQWCEEKQKCLRVWEEDCPSLETIDPEEPVENEQSETETEEPKAKTVEEVRARVQERQQEMAQEQEGLEEGEQKVFQNQNQVRLAVHALLESENIIGGIGPQVSAIAREFNNSIQATINAEERIERKGAFARFFTGGDEEAAEEIDAAVNQNRVRIEQLKGLREQCNCTSEAKAYMLEQIQNMELEQTRLQQRSEGEKQSKGIFGWLWK